MSLLRAVLASSMRTGDARGPWVLLTLLLLAGCATGRPPSGSLLTGHRAAHLSPRFLDERASGGDGPLDMGSGGPASLPLHLVQGRLVEVDRFEGVLVRAGLNDSGLLPAPEADFTPEDAAELYDELLARPVTLAGFGPRLVAAHLLREVMDGEGVLGGGPGAAVVLHMANPSAQEGTGNTGSSVQAPQGPGQWGPVKESMSRRAARYQEQVSGRPVSESYTVRNVRFDGYKDGVLLEAKRPGYANKFTDKLAPKRWFVRNARKMVEQAQRQLGAANGTPIHWHVAEANVAEAIRLLFKHGGVNGIEVIHTAVLP
ncbi:hypothetical protein F0U59_36450 [Archangium gephyra]|nr:hypothetical protein F0U59_36450 [Archangium gephyra]